MILLDRLEESGFLPDSISALEMFVGDGSFRTVDLINRVEMFEGWDINKHRVRKLKEKFPGISCRVGDAKELVEVAYREGRQYDLISMDASLRCFGKAGYCEHFDVLGRAVALLKNPGALLMNVATKAILGERKHIKRRAEFYQESAEGVSFHWLFKKYDEFFNKCEKKIVYSSFEPHCYIKGYNFGLFVLEDI
jgi:hypothetical protein